jgi:hypothetical protein
MKNEPVAWMYERPNGSAKLTFVREPMAGTIVKETPLYTHPTNLTEIIEKNKPEIEKVNAYIKLLEEEIQVLKAKTLTDEEIVEVYRTVEQDFALTESKKPDGGWRNFPVELGRAILRKAQEK